MAGFVHFDPDGWQHPEGEDPPAKAAKVAKVGEGLAALSTLAGVHAAGIRSLDPNKPPRGVSAPDWSCAVRDALALLNEGWAETALSLGWGVLDLFGAVPAPTGDPEGDGLAVRLAGRKVVALDGGCAVCRDARGGRFYFHRPCVSGAVPLWSLGRGR